jgi:tetratricopeptide (TPR) repeat protein
LEWKNDISARYYFWFVPHTWGDFHWNLLRDRVEDMTDSLHNIFNLATSQKPSYYFAPCLLSDWIWDGRFYFSLEPSRQRAVSVYSREAISFDSWVPNLLLFYLTWGQAPAPLAEGAAAYFDYPHFWAQQYLRTKELDSISRFITTFKYRQLPAEKALMEAGSFVRFLVEKYGKGLFENLYRGSTDLTVKEELSKLYGKPLDSLEAEWRSFLLNFKPEAAPLRAIAREEFWNYRFEQALNLYRTALELDSNSQPNDYEDVAVQFYNLGAYDSALAYYVKACRLGPALWQRPYVAANFYLLLDDTGRESLYYRKVLELDTSIADGIVRQATYFFEGENFHSAESLYQLALKKKIRADDLAELNLNLGYLKWRMKGDFKKGNELLNSAWNFYRNARSNSPGTPLPYWRLGELFLYKNMPDSAEANLKFALFLETRPYYLAKLLIRLGNLYDVLNRRKEALDNYRQVLKLSAASLDQRRAQGYLKKPFRMSVN